MRRQQYPPARRRAFRTACALALCALLAGCATGEPGDGSLSSLFGSNDRREVVVVSEAQACAIGYDLARSIHDTVSLRRTVIVAPKQAGPCERHALNYLRLAGFRIDRKATGNSSDITLDIELTRFEGGTVSAVARLGRGLTIARSYRPVHSGVMPLGPISIQHLNPDTYATRRGESSS